MKSMKHEIMVMVTYFLSAEAVIFLQMHQHAKCHHCT